MLYPVLKYSLDFSDYRLCSEGIRSTLPIDRLKVFGVASAAGGSKLTAMLPANGPASLTTTSLTANQETEVASLTPSRQQNMVVSCSLAVKSVGRGG